MVRRRASSGGVYAISVAAELSGLGLSSLRLYERKGLLSPSRTGGAPDGTAKTTWNGSAASANSPWSG